jgi:hypothetical protein
MSEQITIQIGEQTANNASNSNQIVIETSSSDRPSIQSKKLSANSSTSSVASVITSDNVTMRLGGFTVIIRKDYSSPSESDRSFSETTATSAKAVVATKRGRAKKDGENEATSGTPTAKKVGRPKKQRTGEDVDNERDRSLSESKAKPSESKNTDSVEPDAVEGNEDKRIVSQARKKLAVSYRDDYYSGSEDDRPKRQTPVLTTNRVTASAKKRGRPSKGDTSEKKKDEVDDGDDFESVVKSHGSSFERKLDAVSAANGGKKMGRPRKSVPVKYEEDEHEKETIQPRETVQTTSSEEKPVSGVTTDLTALESAGPKKRGRARKSELDGEEASKSTRVKNTVSYVGELSDSDFEFGLTKSPETN